MVRGDDPARFEVIPVGVTNKGILMVNEDSREVGISNRLGSGIVAITNMSIIEIIGSH
jgi:hypothetical protein